MIQFRDKSLAKKRQMEKDDPTMKIKKRVKVKNKSYFLMNLISLILIDSCIFNKKRKKT